MARDTAVKIQWREILCAKEAGRRLPENLERDPSGVPILEGLDITWDVAGKRGSSKKSDSSNAQTLERRSARLR